MKYLLLKIWLYVLISYNYYCKNVYKTTINLCVFLNLVKYIYLYLSGVKFELVPYIIYIFILCLLLSLFIYIIDKISPYDEMSKKLETKIEKLKTEIYGN